MLARETEQLARECSWLLIVYFYETGTLCYMVADLETELLLRRWCLSFSCEKLLKIFPLSLSPDVEVGLDMGRLVQQSRQRQGLSQKDLAVVSGIVIITDYLRM